jgi:hypothetical protein
MKKLIILIFLGITINVIAQDDRWVYYGAPEIGGSYYYYDKETLDYKINSTVVWIKIVCDPYYYVEPLKKSEMYRLVQIELFCNDRKLKFLQSIVYFDDNTMKSNNYGVNSESQTITPESMGERLYKTICK